MCAKDARSRDCSVPENPGINSSTLGMPGFRLQCAVDTWCVLRIPRLGTAVCQRILVSTVVH